MAGNPPYSLNASDSGFLDALGGLTPKSHRVDRRREQPTLADGLHLGGGGDQVSGASNADDGQIDRQLRDVPLPADFIKRMQDSFDVA